MNPWQTAGLPLAVSSLPRFDDPTASDHPLGRWAEGNLCKHSPMLISSAKEPPQAWQDVVGCALT